MFRKISREEAARISPWPNRISGMAPWQKTRNTSSVESEYEARYVEMRKLWNQHKQSFPNLSPALLPLSFVHKLNCQNWAQMSSLPSVYGSVNLDKYLLSFQDELYEGSLPVAEAFFRQVIVQSVQRLVDRGLIRVVVELGCGAGINLINIAANCAIRAVGCELSNAAVSLIGEISSDTGLPIEAARRNYMTDSISDLARGEDWGLMTVHSIEQTPEIDVSWIERILNDEFPPKVGIHFEPLHVPGGQFAADCKRYAEINDYNREFMETMRKAEAKGLIEIEVVDPRIIGSQAHNPTTLLVWRPCSRAI
jgi:hypothetical protein